MRRALALGAISLAAALFGAAGARAAVSCDGRGDAAAALNAALAAGGTVRIAQGVCLLSGSLVIPSSTDLSGAGIGRTVLRAARGGAFNVIELRDGAGNVAISNLTVDGSADAGGTVPHQSSGVLVPPGSSNVRLQAIEAENAADNGIDISGSHVDVTDSVVHHNWHNGIYVIGRGHGPGAGRARFIRILRNRVSDNSLARPPGSTGKTFDGIDLDPRHGDCLVDGNTVIDNDIILLDHGALPSGPDQVSNNTISDPHLTVVNGAGAAGIDVADNIDGFRLTGNRILGVRHFGIIVGGRARNGLISGNTIRDTTAEGILLRGGRGAEGPRNIQITGNAVSPGPEAGGRAAIAVRHMAGVSVVGNSVGGALDLGRAGPGLVARDNH